MSSLAKSSKSKSPRQSSPKHAKTDTEWVMVDDDATSSTQQNDNQFDKVTEETKDGSSSAGTKHSNAASQASALTTPSTQSRTKQPKSTPSPSQPELNSLLSTLSTQRSELSSMQTCLLEAQAQIQEERDLFQAQYYTLRIQQEERETQFAKEKKQEWRDDLEGLRLESAVRAAGEEARMEKLMAQMEGLVMKVEKTEKSTTREEKGEERSEAIEILGKQIEQLAMGMQQLAETISKIQTMQFEKFEAAERNRQKFHVRFANIEREIEAIREEKRLAAATQQPTISLPAQSSDSNHSSSQQRPIPLTSKREPYLGNKHLPKAKDITGTPSSPSLSSGPTSSPRPPPRRRPRRPVHTTSANIRPHSSRLDCEWFLDHHDPW
ncbi:hypothetical protein CERZMDRAFT_96311 [Cercospora zeae-maydis SCOH1-5]|uniref:Uncharacterized protein n=1 Tax=Cercospora zeae-maydis SCOH1-5 TaxID=717836 RepID=A0A6A6FJM1_9PEZI|nr:hypothetical protein CERZMDRAFT_96311 [Cercospora zeae-maydis SCOH1-5]